jgi:hypothetical protein
MGLLEYEARKSYFVANEVQNNKAFHLITVDVG